MSKGPYYKPGKYWVRVVNQSLGVTKTNKPQFVLSFQVQGKVNPADPEGTLENCGEQYERSIFRTITDNTVDWLMEDLKHLCQRGELEPNLPGFEYLDPKTPGFLNLIGVEFEAYCDHDTYEGTTREKWGVSTGGGGLEVPPLEDKGVRELNAMYGKALKGFTGPKPAPTRTERQPEPAAAGKSLPPGTFDDQDVPF